MTAVELCRSSWEHLGARHWCSLPKGHTAAHTCDNETFHDHNGPEMVRNERDWWRDQFYEMQARWSAAEVERWLAVEELESARA